MGTLASSGLAMIVLSASLSAFGCTAAQAYEPITKACMRRDALDEHIGEGRYVPDAVMAAAERHCKKEIKADEKLEYSIDGRDAPTFKAAEPCEVRKKDDSEDVAKCIASWLSFWNWNYGQPEECIGILNNQLEHKATAAELQRKKKVCSDTENVSEPWHPPKWLAILVITGMLCVIFFFAFRPRHYPKGYQHPYNPDNFPTR
jgi:hypothetical protein